MSKRYYYSFLLLTLLTFNTSNAESLKSTASTILDKTYSLVQSTINSTLNIFADGYDGDGNTEISIADNGGTSFSVTIFKNGSTVSSVFLPSLVQDTAITESFLENDIISVDISNIGLGTASGLIVYLIE